MGGALQVTVHGVANGRRLVGYCPWGRKWAAPGRLLSMGSQRVDTTERREEERLNNSKCPQFPGRCFGKLTLSYSVFRLDSNTLHNLCLTFSVPFASLTDGCCQEAAWVGSRVSRNVSVAGIVNIPQVCVCPLHDKQRPKPQRLPSGTVLTNDGFVSCLSPSSPLCKSDIICLSSPLFHQGILRIEKPRST